MIYQQHIPQEILYIECHSIPKLDSENAAKNLRLRPD